MTTELSRDELCELRREHRHHPIRLGYTIRQREKVPQFGRFDPEPGALLTCRSRLLTEDEIFLVTMP